MFAADRNGHKSQDTNKALSITETSCLPSPCRACKRAPGTISKSQPVLPSATPEVCMRCAVRIAVQRRGQIDSHVKTPHPLVPQTRLHKLHTQTSQ
eukprot:4119937-Amphidinium_carterae.1